jgi:mRNA interferase RelE/StbE
VKPEDFNSSSHEKITMQLSVPTQVAERLRRMHPSLKRKIKGALKIIIANPNHGKALREELSGLRSLRVSRFRIIYRIRNKIIEIVAIGPRAIIYQETYKLIEKEREGEKK